jgi:hypothetical protein
MADENENDELITMPEFLKRQDELLEEANYQGRIQSMFSKFCWVSPV